MDEDEIMEPTDDIDSPLLKERVSNLMDTVVSQIKSSQ
jgi:hypothetical protein